VPSVGRTRPLSLCSKREKSKTGNFEWESNICWKRGTTTDVIVRTSEPRRSGGRGRFLAEKKRIYAGKPIESSRIDSCGGVITDAKTTRDTKSRRREKLQQLQADAAAGS